MIISVQCPGSQLRGACATIHCEQAYGLRRVVETRVIWIIKHAVSGMWLGRWGASSPEPSVYMSSVPACRTSLTAPPSSPYTRDTRLLRGREAERKGCFVMALELVNTRVRSQVRRRKQRRTALAIRFGRTLRWNFDNWRLEATTKWLVKLSRLWGFGSNLPQTKVTVN